MGKLYEYKRKSAKEKSSERQIDRLMAKQTGDDSAWEEPIQVPKTKAASLSIPPKLAARAAFLAKLHREKGLKEWLTRIIRERIELEEIAFAEVNRELKANQSLPDKGVKRTSNRT
jgi:hypothetical protein